MHRCEISIGCPFDENRRADCVEAITHFGDTEWDIDQNARLTPFSREALAQTVLRVHGTPFVVALLRPGDLLHLDIKKIGRFQAVGCRITGHRRGRIHRAGWEYVHVAIDDHSRIAFSQILPHQKASSAAAWLQAAVDYYAQLGIAVRRVLTDDGPGYRSAIFRRLCLQLDLRQRFTRAYTPRTNGKAERFIQTALREWAYARAYDNSQVRAAELPRWIHPYNWHRRHASLKHAPPIGRSGLDRNNRLSHHPYVLRCPQDDKWMQSDEGSSNRGICR